LNDNNFNKTPYKFYKKHKPQNSGRSGLTIHHLRSGSKEPNSGIHSPNEKSQNEQFEFPKSFEPSPGLSKEPSYKNKTSRNGAILLTNSLNNNIIINNDTYSHSIDIT